jgi:hypothetical protein
MLIADLDELKEKIFFKLQSSTPQKEISTEEV